MHYSGTVNVIYCDMIECIMCTEKVTHGHLSLLRVSW